MTTEQLLQQSSKVGLTKRLNELQTQNLLKNAFLTELSKRLNYCYDKDLNLKQDQTKKLINYISNEIDGLTQTSSELSNISANVTTVCDYLEEL